MTSSVRKTSFAYIEIHSTGDGVYGDNLIPVQGLVVPHTQWWKEAPHVLFEK